MEKGIALFTDLYELTMAQAYFKTGNTRVTFELLSGGFRQIGDI
ncbi:MAG: hypothetical protein ACUVQY_06235 [Thermoproteota archaeon]